MFITDVCVLFLFTNKVVVVVQFLLRRFDAIFVAFKSHPQIACVNGRRFQRDLGAICHCDIAVVSNMFET